MRRTPSPFVENACPPPRTLPTFYRYARKVQNMRGEIYEKSRVDCRKHRQQRYAERRYCVYRESEKYARGGKREDYQTRSETNLKSEAVHSSFPPRRIFTVFTMTGVTGTSS